MPEMLTELSVESVFCLWLENVNLNVRHTGLCSCEYLVQEGGEKDDHV